MSRLKNKDFSYKVPNVQPDLDYLHNGQSHKQPSITWVGHSTFFIQLDGLSIMTDPVWASQMAFQKRLAPPGIPIAEVPPVDIVLISHSHYDHLSIQTLRQLKGKRQLLVPAGLSSKLRMKGFANVRELHWWESVEIGGARFTFVPSQHWTRRTPWDMNSSHWGGWVIEPKKHTDAAAWQAECGEATSGNTYRPVVSPAPTLYFAGDSGYFKGFSEIGSRFDIDVALMPIGAYEPEWFMGPQHVTPEQALQAFEDTGAKWFVPMHYGAFKLADDTPREALCRLEAGRVERGIESERIVVLPHGETWKLFGRS
ncbi:MBL fold metallo-hydrolase [Paenibacillus sp. NEAU-GSW1]|uniref:MBL fold metallo-hydrolase n=1 Tax=Paenibacillus sp. NEAU-GSW1 TaxID=2682486 RepID=UPI0012E283E1|nr:MBL fold metallo-hydrolase [Paenibacillus sp. NEAU-GSW1]MUT67757.1 MBL fold metallo-hydrolase [Paenibacillus sp. NEAU-GSW1]